MPSSECSSLLRFLSLSRFFIYKGRDIFQFSGGSRGTTRLNPAQTQPFDRIREFTMVTMSSSSQRSWITIGLLMAALACADRLPANWTNKFNSVDLRTAYITTPWFETSLYGESPRTSTLAAAVNRCWSSSGMQLSEDYCLERALNVAFTAALADLDPQHNTTAIGAGNRRSTPSVERSPSKEFEIVDLELNGDTFRPRLQTKPHDRRSQTQNAPTHIRYNGTLPRAFLFQRKRGNLTHEVEADRPVFVATDGFQKEIAHLQRTTLTVRGDESPDSGLIYEAGGGIKVQSRSHPVTAPEYVQDWMNSESGAGDATSMSDYLISVAQSVGYLGFELNNAEAEKDGKFIMVAESLGFGMEWESNWNWCFTPADTEDCKS